MAANDALALRGSQTRDYNYMPAITFSCTYPYVDTVRLCDNVSSHFWCRSAGDRACVDRRARCALCQFVSISLGGYRGGYNLLPGGNCGFMWSWNKFIAARRLTNLIYNPQYPYSFLLARKFPTNSPLLSFGFLPHCNPWIHLWIRCQTQWSSQ